MRQSVQRMMSNSVELVVVVVLLVATTTITTTVEITSTVTQL